MIAVTESLAIPLVEVTFVAARSSGPGGQNVNKVETRVTLLFRVDESPSLSAEQKARIRQRLAGRINKDGVLRLSSQRHRSQRANREEVLARFAELLRWALAEDVPRVPTTVPPAARARRLAAKKRRSRLKSERTAPVLEE